MITIRLSLNHDKTIADGADHVFANDGGNLMPETFAMSDEDTLALVEIAVTLMLYITDHMSHPDLLITKEKLGDDVSGGLFVGMVLSVVVDPYNVDPGRGRELMGMS